MADSVNGRWSHVKGQKVLELIPRAYLDPGPFADVDPPETVQAIWIRFREARGQDCAATLSQIAAAGNWTENIVFSQQTG